MLSFALREGLRNVRRHRALSLVLAGSTGLVLVLLAFLLAIGQAIVGRLAEWEQRVELVAFVSPDMSPDDVTRVHEALGALPNVAGVTYTSSAQAWEELIAEAGAPADLVSAAEVNLVPGAFTVRLRPGHVAPDQLEQLAGACRAVPGVDEVEFAADLLASYAGFRRDLALILRLGLVIMMGLLIGLTGATLRLGLGARAEELRGWLWEGASPRLLGVVCATEAALQGLLGSVWAVCLYAMGERYATTRWGLRPPDHWPLFALVLVLGPGLCLIASLMSTRRLLRSLRLTAGALLLGGLLVHAGAVVADSELVPPRTTQDFDAEHLSADLARLQEQRSRALEESQRLGGESRGLLSQLEAIGKIEDTLHIRIQSTKDEEARLSAEIAELEARILASEHEYRVLGERVLRISRLLQHAPAASPVDIFLAAQPQGAALRAKKVRQVLLQQRLEAFGALERSQRVLRRQREEGRAAQTAGAALAARLADDLQVQAAARAERRALLQTIQSEQAIAAATVAQVEDALARLEALLGELPAGEAGGQFYGPVPIRDLRGVLPWPVDGARVVRGFGRRVAPVFFTVTHHDGWLLQPPAAGAPVRAVHDGLVEYVGWLHGYGKLLILDHGGGYLTLYGHCAEIRTEPGRMVRAGQVVATVGTTGPVNGPVLYFAVRVQGAAQDPANWLTGNED